MLGDKNLFSPDEPGTRVYLAWLTVTLKMEAVNFSETSLKFAGQHSVTSRTVVLFALLSGGLRTSTGASYVRFCRIV
jgi:hypothetical protein